MTFLDFIALCRPPLARRIPSPACGGGLGWGRADEVIE
jgi:hypothetical protein